MLVTTTPELPNSKSVKVVQQVGDDACHLLVKDGAVEAEFLQQLAVELGPVLGTIPNRPKP